MQEYFSHSVVLRELEILISAGLESTHKTIVNATICVWNCTFGKCESTLEYPVHLKEALFRIRPVADIILPGFPESLKSEGVADQRQPIEYVDSQDNPSLSGFSGLSTMESALNKPTLPHFRPSPQHRLRHFTPQVVIENAGASKKRSRESTPGGKRKLRKRDITPKLRHDDSQVQFQPVYSSPTDRVNDSQLLTSKQKETRERQLAEAAMFPDLRSSPYSKPQSAEEDQVSDPELPIYRSSSKARNTSMLAERQATPTLVLPSDDDNFVPSSPTPKRSARQETEVTDPPSSPPEAPIRDQVIYNRGLMHSSATEGFPDSVDLTVMSFDPTELDAHVHKSHRTVSTFEKSPGDLNDSPYLIIKRQGAGNKVQGIELESKDEIPEPQPPGESVLDPSPSPAPPMPSTPTKTCEESPIAEKTPQFVDALTSPASSDKLFEDALSHSQTKPSNRHGKQTSSPISDVDESSLMRVMENYDEGADVGKQLRWTRSSTKDASSLAGAHHSVPRRALVVKGPAAGPAPELHSGETDKAIPSTDRNQTSSLPSRIMETPAAKPAGSPLQRVFDDDGEEIDLESTIVVDCSILENQDTRPVFKQGSRKKSATFSAKRKLAESDLNEANEVPDSQDVIARVAGKKFASTTVEDGVLISTVSLSPNKGNPSRKKRKSVGRPRKSPQAKDSRIQRHQTEDDVPDLNQSVLSIDLDVSLASTEVEGTFLSTDQEAAVVKTTGEVHSDKEVEVEKGEVAATTHGELQPAVDKATPHIEIFPFHGKVDIVNDILDDSTFPDISSLGRVAADQRGVGVVTTEAVPSALNGENEKIVAGGSPAHTPVNAPDVEPALPPTVVEVENRVEMDEFEVTVQDLKTQLTNVIKGLQSVSLTREEANHFEDLFMSAKEQLYGAARRGREGEKGREI